MLPYVCNTFTVIVIVVIVSQCADPTCANCILELDSSLARIYTPHFVDESYNIIQPETLDSKKNTIVLNVGQSYTVACSGNALNVTGKEFSLAKCHKAGNGIQIDSTILNYNQLNCKKAVKETFRDAKGLSIGTVKAFEICWKIKDTCIRQITFWHDASNMITTHTRHVLPAKYQERPLKRKADDQYSSIGKKRPSRIRRSATFSRPQFRKGRYFERLLDITRAYSKPGQKAIFGKILGLKKYITDNMYLVRGHLAPDADFKDFNMKSATYYYINVAPQWTSFNNGNWKKLEFGIRKLASSTGNELTIYTGIFGQLALTNSYQEQKIIYLADYKGKKVIPVPKYFWKVVYNTNKKQATAFIGINNPFLTQITGADTFCKDVCNSVRWMDWSMKIPGERSGVGASRFEIAKGYIFCCNLEDFRKTVNYMPNLGNNIPLLV